MKSLKITLEHGRVWRAETSDGKYSQAASLGGALANLWPVSERPPDYVEFEKLLGTVFNGIRDSGSTGNIARGQASG